MPFVVIEKDHDLNSGGSKFLAGGTFTPHIIQSTRAARCGR